jgi:uncharacterized protein (DUF1501 family)
MGAFAITAASTQEQKLNMLATATFLIMISPEYWCRNEHEYWTRRRLPAAKACSSAPWAWRRRWPSISRPSARQRPSTNTDYKALVCIFLYGGNDYANTVVPYDPTNYALYHQIRAGAAGEGQAGIALARAALAPYRADTQRGAGTDRQPAVRAGAASSRDSRAVGCRKDSPCSSTWGPLIKPTTLAQYQSTNRGHQSTAAELFSHNDQQSIWQANGSEGATIGWGGRLGDIALSATAIAQLAADLYFSERQRRVRRGTRRPAVPDQPGGAIKINALNGPLRDAVSAIITRNSSHVLENEYAVVTRRSIAMEGVVNGALANVNPATSFGSGNPLASQLKIVARLIGARSALSMRRQVFFVSLGGFDNHNLLMDGPSETAPARERRDERVLRGHRGAGRRQPGHHVHGLGLRTHAVIECGWLGSRLGFASLRDGRRREWRRFYGTAPHVSIQTDDQVGQGRLLPSTSVDEFAATLARWFGCSAAELPGILPNVGNFSNTSLGFV